ncbi:MAG TPA: family 16 glycosylhydrolase [Chitinophagaceae bacterium]|nr:family 16 glycosylhydrolase [Chitinophagaceae bacterium]
MQKFDLFPGYRGRCLVLPALALLACLPACSKQGSDPGTPATPAASIANVTQERSTQAAVFHFQVSLDRAATQDVSIQYATVPGSAQAGKDFTTVSGTLHITAGSLTGTIDVPVSADSLRSPNKTFQVQLSNPQHCTLRTDHATGTIVDENGLYFPVDNTGYTGADSYPGYTLVWSDEFDGNQINSGNWGFDTGNSGWGNHELENYTNRKQNAFVSQGNLIIEARQEDLGGSSYTSARMLTKGKKAFQYGRVDIRARMPSGKGIWPALWMLGDNIDQAGWPACGEMDILELLGQQPDKIYGTLHWGATPAAHASKGNSYQLSGGSFDQQFHLYSLIWKQDSVQILVDDKPYLQVSRGDVTGAYPFNANFFFIFNVAVGGDWPGAPDGTTQFPQRMIVDYIRVYQ